MNSGIDDLLDMVDEWKFKLHDKLKKMTPAERQAFWTQIHESACKSGLHTAEAQKTVKDTEKRKRRTG